MTEAEKDERVGEVLQNAYRLERVLGEGGMGTVYEASHLRLARRFAVKLLRKEAAKRPTALTRFQREAEIVSALGHAHILEVIDFNHTEDGTPYIVMELLDGDDLGAVLDHNGGRLDLDIAGQIIEQTASALQAAHEQGIVHRDLKPENIFLCRRPGQEGLFVKVVDFGISKILGEAASITYQYQVVGTPQYMSPEQAQESAAVDLRTDIYSLAVIAYELLTGERPFSADTVPSLLLKIVQEEPVPLREIRPDVPGPVAEVIQRAMLKDREQRFSSIKEFSDVLLETIHGEIFQPAAKAATIDLVLPRWQARDEPAEPRKAPDAPATPREEPGPDDVPTKLLRPLSPAERASTLSAEGEMFARSRRQRVTGVVAAAAVVLVIGATAALLGRSGGSERAPAQPQKRTGPTLPGAGPTKQIAAPASQPAARSAARRAADAGAADDMQSTTSRPAATRSVAARRGAARATIAKKRATSWKRRGMTKRRKPGAKQRKVGVGMMGY